MVNKIEEEKSKFLEESRDGIVTEEIDCWEREGGRKEQEIRVKLRVFSEWQRSRKGRDGNGK